MPALHPENFCYHAPPVLISLAPTADNVRGPRYTEQVLNAVHEANRRRLRVHVEFGSHAGTTALYCRFPARLRKVITGQLTTLYPDLSLTFLSERTTDPPRGNSLHRLSLRLSLDVFPLRTYRHFEDMLCRETVDPIASVLQPLTSGAHGLHTRIQLTLRPSLPWQRPLARFRLACRARFLVMIRDIGPQDTQTAREKLGRLFKVRLTLLVHATRDRRRDVIDAAFRKSLNELDLVIHRSLGIDNRVDTRFDDRIQNLNDPRGICFCDRSDRKL